MPATFLLTFLLAATSVPAAGSPAAPASSAAPAAHADPCDRLSSMDDAQACGGQPLCSARQRVQLACEVRDALEKRYVFFPVKGEMLRGQGKEFDSRRHLDACVEQERAIALEDDPLRFYDRMRRCTAAFADGHLLLSAPVRLPQVALGLGLRIVEGRVYIANRQKKLVSNLKTVAGVRDMEDLVAAGNEVLAIDGHPVQDELRRLAQYLPASSDAARLERAVDALTRRDFAFPERRSCTLTVSVNGTRRDVELPWWISPDAEGHLMAQAWLRRTGVATTDLLSWRYDQPKDTWDQDLGSTEGYLRTEPILPPLDASSLREYTDDRDRPAVLFGEVVRRRDRAFCYLQILTFHTENLSGGGEGRQPFTAVIAAFVKQCKDKQLDLVLDLRQNEGGYLAHSSALLAALGEQRKAYPGGALLLRASTQNQLVYQQRSPTASSAPARTGDAFEPRHIAEAIGAAKRARVEFTPAFLEQPLKASDAVGGYQGRVVALVAPTCMSACDRVAALLKSSGRATLIGEPTEGAGGSQQEARNLAVRWTDPEGLISLAIPNAAMGVQHALPVTPGDRPADEFFQRLTFENRPVRPDVPYATRLDDLSHHNRGWLEAVDAALFGTGLRAGVDRPQLAGAAGP